MPNVTRKMRYGNFDKPGFHRGLNLGIEFDTREFDRDLRRLNTNMIKSLLRGLAKALRQLLDDICLEAPKIPVDTGALWGSITTFVNNKLSTRSKYGIPIDQEIKSTEPNYRQGEEGLLVVNSPYATVQHEKWPEKHKAGAGMYFVLSKLISFRNKYITTIVTEMKRTRI